MSNQRQDSITTIDTEVSFSVGKSDYGTIMVPKGTKVFRHRVGGIWSDWFVTNPGNLPDNGRLLFNGKHSDFFIHDAVHYGISLPNANVKDGNKGTQNIPSPVHFARHY